MGYFCKLSKLIETQLCIQIVQIYIKLTVEKNLPTLKSDTLQS